MNRDPVEKFCSVEARREQEMKLANKLKTLCTIYGKERVENLGETGHVFLQMGQLYLEEAAHTQGTQQKLSFIKCCALLVCARVRFETIDDRTRIDDVEEVLNRFSDVIYKTCKINPESKALPAISAELKCRVQELRDAEGWRMQDFERVPGKLENHERILLEGQKITDIKEFMKNTTENYKTLMQTVADECIDLLGEPPCSFCGVGLGSLARDEITMYSDFEHVIVLEDGVEEAVDHDAMKEYFRWFAVMFQVIIIGLGETFLRSIGIESINNHYSNDPSENWFYDVFTPSGIAFDGMVPHSCMNPLGRTEPTKSRAHKIEFIQSASRMANFLTADAHLKNGYFIKDVLTRSCMVYGDAGLYCAFQTACADIVQSEDVFLSVRKEALSNVNQFVRGNIDVFDLHHFNAKSSLYRPITVLLSLTAKKIHINVNSTFDIIEELSKCEFFSPEIAHRVRYAAAIAFEVRIRAYHQKGQQRHGLSKKQLLDLVGVEAVLNYRSVIRLLTPASEYEALSAKLPENLLESEILQEVNKLLVSDEFELAVQRFGAIDAATISHELLFNMFCTYCRLGFKQICNESFYFGKAASFLSDNFLLNCSDVQKSTIHATMAAMYVKVGDFANALSACMRWQWMFWEYESVRQAHGQNLSYMIDLELSVYMKMVPSVAETKSRTVLSWPVDLETKCVLKFYTLQLAAKSDDSDKVRADFRALVTRVCLNVSKFRGPMQILFAVCRAQATNGWDEDAIVTLEHVLEYETESGEEHLLFIENRSFYESLKLFLMFQYHKWSIQKLNIAEYIRQRNPQSVIELIESLAVLHKIVLYIDELISRQNPLLGKYVLCHVVRKVLRVMSCSFEAMDCDPSDDEKSGLMGYLLDDIVDEILSAFAGQMDEELHGKLAAIGCLIYAKWLWESVTGRKTFLTQEKAIAFFLDLAYRSLLTSFANVVTYMFNPETHTSVSQFFSASSIHADSVSNLKIYFWEGAVPETFSDPGRFSGRLLVQNLKKIVQMASSWQNEAQMQICHPGWEPS